MNARSATTACALLGCMIPAFASASSIWDFTIGRPGNELVGTGHIELAATSGSSSANVISFDWSGRTFGLAWSADETDINTVSWAVNSSGQSFDSFQLQLYNVHANVGSFVNMWLTMSFMPSNNLAYSKCWDTLYTSAGYRCGGASLDIGTSSGITWTPLTPTVPVPAAVWLLGSGLIGLFGFARTRMA
jgi:hypothetical protein